MNPNSRQQQQESDGGQGDRPRSPSVVSSTYRSESEYMVPLDSLFKLGDTSNHSSSTSASNNDNRGRPYADAAFSSSSEEEDEEESAGIPPRPSAFARKRPTKYAAAAAGSEFDKALLTGVPSRGAASFDGSDFGIDTATMAPASTTAPSTEIILDDNRSTGSAMTFDTELQFSQQSSQAQQQQQPMNKQPNKQPKQRRAARLDGSSIASSRPGPPQPLIIRNPSSQIPSEHRASTPISYHPSDASDDLAQGVLPDVLMTMRQKIESLTLFDSDMLKYAEDSLDGVSRDSLKRSSQQSLSAAVLVSLAHKRYERRRLAAMEIEKVVRSLVHQKELDRVRAILLLLSDDYVRSTSEDARKGGVVALAACGIGLKKALPSEDYKVLECRDLILASVVHACQDHSQRVRYYATESLFNIVKLIPTLAVQHFFILFEILRSLYADVDADVRSGAELLDKKLKEVIVGAINSGSFTADACVPIFARFVYMRNKATKRLTLTWLQELNEKLLGNPVLEFLHLFLGGIFAMIADPNIQIRQSALAFLQSVLPKLLMDNEAFDDRCASMKVDFDKLIQSLVTTLEHPDPFVRKVAMYWMCRIVKAFMTGDEEGDESRKVSPASLSVRNSLPHVLPGILLSIGDTFHSKASTKDSFLPDQTTHSLAEQTNACLQAAVRRDGNAYATHLDGFLVALREELDSPGNSASSTTERKQYRMDVTPDGTGIESPGWFRTAKKSTPEEATVKSRLCALEWITVLYESVVPNDLKADYAKEFTNPIIHQLVGNPPELIIFKSLEVLAKITVPVDGEKRYQSVLETHSSSEDAEGAMASAACPTSDEDATFALGILDYRQGQSKSRDRDVFSAIIQLHACNHHLLADLSRVIQYMCTLQPPEFVFVSFAVELDRFVRMARKVPSTENQSAEEKKDELPKPNKSNQDLAGDLHFVASFVQQMTHVILATEEAKSLRELLRDCIGRQTSSDRDQRRTKLFHILLFSFAHSLVASVSLCLWAGAFRTASFFLQSIHPLDINLVFLLELDKMVELLERPLFRNFHLLMLEADEDPHAEGSGAMLFRTLTLLLMIVPQSTCYRVLRDRLVTVSRFRQSALNHNNNNNSSNESSSTTAGLTEGDEQEGKQHMWLFASRVLDVRELHCQVRWKTIRSESLETVKLKPLQVEDNGKGRREWLGFGSKDEERASKANFIEKKRLLKSGFKIEEIKEGIHHLKDMPSTEVKNYIVDAKPPKPEKGEDGDEWKEYWTQKTGS